MLSREIGVQEFGRRAFLSAAAGERLYRTGSAAIPSLVVESLGERFVVEMATSENLGCRPARVTWFVRR